MEHTSATGDITAAILSTESHRRKMGKTSGRAAACNEALRALHQLLARERGALQLHGPAARTHSANVAALKSEIARVNALAGEAGPGAIPTGSRSVLGPVASHEAPRSLSRSKGRRTMGRSER